MMSGCGDSTPQVPVCGPEFRIYDLDHCASDSVGHLVGDAVMVKHSCRKSDELVINDGASTEAGAISDRSIRSDEFEPISGVACEDVQADDMLIKVVNVAGETTCLRAYSWERVRDLKCRLQDEAQYAILSINIVRLVFAGRELSTDDDMLFEYDLVDGAEIQCFIHPVGNTENISGSTPVHIRMPSGRTVPTRINLLTTAADVLMLASILAVREDEDIGDVDSLQLYFKGKQLPSTAVLKNSRVEIGSVVTLR